MLATKSSNTGKADTVRAAVVEGGCVEMVFSIDVESALGYVEYGVYGNASVRLCPPLIFILCGVS